MQIRNINIRPQTFDAILIDPLSEPGEKFHEIISVLKPIKEKRQLPFEVFKKSTIEINGPFLLDVKAAKKIYAGLKIAIEKAKEFDDKYTVGEPVRP